MTKEQINIAIAQACGIDIEKYVMEEGGINTSALPDYCNDLNAMHEAEKALTRNQHETYYKHLNYNHNRRAPIWHTTAAQRAEAFLKTIKKWNSNKI
jgi:hypothetical protein